MSKSKKKGNKPAQNNTQKKAEKTREVISEEINKADELEETGDFESEEFEETAVSESEELEDKEELSVEKDSEEESEKKSGKKDKPAQAEVNENSSEKDEFLKLSFVEKCKKDPVIPVALILAFVAVVVAAIYFMLPNSKTPSMGFTLDEFRDRYDSGEVSTQLYSNGLDIRINYVNYIDRSITPSILGEKETFKSDADYVDYFSGDAGLILDAGLEGATRKNDNELAFLRVYVEYDFNPVWMIFANSLQAVYPDLSKFDALDIAIHEMNDFNGDGLYAVRGDIAFRIIPVKQGEGENEVTYIVVEFVPKSAISESQIGHVVEITESEASSSDMAASDASDTVSTDASASVSEPVS